MLDIYASSMKTVSNLITNILCQTFCKVNVLNLSRYDKIDLETRLLTPQIIIFMALSEVIQECFRERRKKSRIPAPILEQIS
jgi:hypothetical protein